MSKEQFKELRDQLDSDKGKKKVRSERFKELRRKIDNEKKF